MKLYNTATKGVERFQPQEEGVVTIYVCGITPYDTTHLGHAFTYTAADVLIRYLEFEGYQVNYVQNVTDIDDDILRKANEVNGGWQEVGNRWTRHFIRDMQTLNVRPPYRFPRATDVIPGIIETVAALVEAGVAYESGGNVYFHVDDWPEYGKLSRIPRSDMLPIANERGNHPDDPHKRDPLDFVLWQAQAPGEPAWDSPWGPGRPGWHIECSTMATQFLGNTIDIHSGGADLLFPHHESEIAQVEPVTGQNPFVRFWMHTAMVRHQGEKMSKSLGNLVMVRDLLRDFSPDAVRFYLGQHHYRDPWTHSPAELEEAAAAVQRLHLAVTLVGGRLDALDPAPALAAFKEAMDQDLDTATALAAATDLAEETIEAAETGHDVEAAQDALRAMASIFGLRLDAETVEARVTEGWNEHWQRFREPSQSPS